MQRILGTVGVSTTAILGLSLLAASAAATGGGGYWEVMYDLAPGSSITTTTPLGMDTDPVTGTFVVEYPATSSTAPLSGSARFASGMFHVTIFQMVGTIPGVLTITGSTDTVLTPDPGGTPGVLSGDMLILDPVPDSSSTGFIHCFGGACGIAGFVASMMIPQTPTGPGPFPLTFNDWDFTMATAGFGDWTAPTKTLMTVTGMGTPLTVAQDFAGREISRMFVPEPASSAGLVGGALLLAALHSARRRRGSRG